MSLQNSISTHSAPPPPLYAPFNQQAPMRPRTLNQRNQICSKKCCRLTCFLPIFDLFCVDNISLFPAVGTRINDKKIYNSRNLGIIRNIVGYKQSCLALHTQFTAISFCRPLHNEAICPSCYRLLH